jgi:hypothetical protein
MDFYTLKWHLHFLAPKVRNHQPSVKRWVKNRGAEISIAPTVRDHYIFWYSPYKMIAPTSGL